jgi:hypothetical protein
VRVSWNVQFGAADEDDAVAHPRGGDRRGEVDRVPLCIGELVELDTLAFAEAGHGHLTSGG